MRITSAPSCCRCRAQEQLRERALESVRAVAKREGGDPQKIEAVYFTSFVMQ